MKKVIASLLMIPALVFSLVACAPAEQGKVEVTEAWVKASEYSDHVGGMTGVFMKITNNTDETVTLVGGTSSFAPMIQTHQVIDGVMSEKPEGIEIKPGETVSLEPGGLHVMLMNLTEAILAGSKVDLKLKFSNNDEIDLGMLLAKTVPAGEETYSPMPMPSPTN